MKPGMSYRLQTFLCIFSLPSYTLASEKCESPSATGPRWYPRWSCLPETCLWETGLLDHRGTTGAPRGVPTGYPGGTPRGAPVVQQPLSPRDLSLGLLAAGASAPRAGGRSWPSSRSRLCLFSRRRSRLVFVGSRRSAWGKGFLRSACNVGLL